MYLQEKKTLTRYYKSAEKHIYIMYLQEKKTLTRYYKSEEKHIYNVYYFLREGR